MEIKKYNENALSLETTETKVEVIPLEQITAQLAQAQASLNNLKNHVIPYWQGLMDEATSHELKTAVEIDEVKRLDKEKEEKEEEIIKEGKSEILEEEIIEEIIE